METNYSRRKIAGIFISILIAVYMLFFFPKHIRDDSDGFTATCTVTKAYTQERRGTDLGGMTDIGLKGVFETEECGTLTIFEPPEGWKISAYVKTAHSGKKYLFHVSNRSNRKDRDFTTTRFEEIKE
jgi:hypothetical protein